MKERGLGDSEKRGDCKGRKEEEEIREEGGRRWRMRDEGREDVKEGKEEVRQERERSGEGGMGNE